MVAALLTGGFFTRLLNQDVFKMPVRQKLLYGRKGLS